VLPAHVVAASAASGLAFSDVVRVRAGLWPLAIAAALALRPALPGSSRSR
jgi:hypothetical protein